MKLTFDQILPDALLTDICSEDRMDSLLEHVYNLDVLTCSCIIEKDPDRTELQGTVRDGEAIRDCSVIFRTGSAELRCSCGTCDNGHVCDHAASLLFAADIAFRFRRRMHSGMRTSGRFEIPDDEYQRFVNDVETYTQEFRHPPRADSKSTQHLDRDRMTFENAMRRLLKVCGKTVKKQDTAARHQQAVISRQSAAQQKQVPKTGTGYPISEYMKHFLAEVPKSVQIDARKTLETVGFRDLSFKTCQRNWIAQAVLKNSSGSAVQLQFRTGGVLKHRLCKDPEHEPSERSQPTFFCEHCVALMMMLDAMYDLDNVFRSRLKRSGTPSQDIPLRQVDAPAPKIRKKSDILASNLLDTFRRHTVQPPAEKEPVHLTPIVGRYYGPLPIFRFTIARGSAREYVVRNPENFALKMHQGETINFGKALTVTPGVNEFEPLSDNWLRLLRTYFSVPGARYAQFGSEALPGTQWMRLHGPLFDEAFSMLIGRTLQEEHFATDWMSPNPPPSPLTFTEGIPLQTATLKATEGGATFILQKKRGHSFIRNGATLYDEGPDTFMRCLPEFAQAIEPLLPLFGKSIFIAEADLPTFCELLGRIPDTCLDIHDQVNLLDSFAPESCTPVYRLSLGKKDELIARVAFRYDSREIPANADPAEYDGIRRNETLEQQFLAPILKNFERKGTRFVINSGDAVPDFLCDELETLQSLGEVFVSDRLQQHEISREKKPTLGISVADGLLSVDIDGGGFPPEELEALYQSLLRRKRWHRLKDGRFLPIQNGGYEKLAEIAHMARLTPAELASGHITLPPYRSLWLNSVLEASEGLSVRSSNTFLQLVHSFRHPEDGEIPLPATLTDVLRPYQKTGFQWMKLLETNNFGGILADEMGLGKTLQVLTWLLTARRKDTGRPSLIVCPASLVINWADEAEKFAPELKPLVLAGSAAERKEVLSSDTDADLFITSYDLLRRDRSLYADKTFYGCILDEGQMIKNQSTLVSKTVKSIRCDRRFVLTGTPIENRLSELWNLFDFLMPGYLFGHSAFVEKLEKPIIKSDSPDARRQLSLLVQPFMMRRLKKDVLKELPDKISHDRRIALSEDERKVYFAEALIAKKIAESGGEGIKILALLTRLRQICCTPGLCFENYSGPNSKLDACIELCTSHVANGHQILLFSQFTSMLDRIRERLNAEGISSLTIVGATTKPQRAKNVRDFNAGKASVFLISLKAGGTGLNLTAADIVIHFDPWWNMAAQNQATDRAHRIGQTHTVQVYRLIAKDTIEEKIIRLQEKKAHLMDAINGDPTAAPLTRDEILALLR